MKTIVLENCIINDYSDVCVTYSGNIQRDVFFTDSTGSPKNGRTVRDAVAGYAATNRNMLCQITGHIARSGRFMIDYITFNKK